MMLQAQFIRLCGSSRKSAVTTLFPENEFFPLYITNMN